MADFAGMKSMDRKRKPIPKDIGGQKKMAAKMQQVRRHGGILTKTWGNFNKNVAEQEKTGAKIQQVRRNGGFLTKM
jgi:hypothetical protein